MKRILIASIIAAGIGMMTAPESQAIPVTVTYTADNVVNAWYQDGGSLDALGLGTNAGNWRDADSAILDLDPGSYTLYWKVSNAGTPSGSNPVAFLASITAGFAIDYPLSSSNWEISTGDPGVSPDFSLLTWIAATEIVQNGTPGSIWWNNNSNGPVAGIDNDAYWIWTDDHNTSTAPSTAYIRTTFNVADGGATLLLMGICLSGIAALKNRQ